MSDRITNETLREWADTARAKATRVVPNRDSSQHLEGALLVACGDIATLARELLEVRVGLRLLSVGSGPPDAEKTASAIAKISARVQDLEESLADPRDGEYE